MKIKPEFENFLTSLVLKKIGYMFFGLLTYVCLSFSDHTLVIPMSPYKEDFHSKTSFSGALLA